MSSQTEKEAVQLVLDAITKGSKLTEDELSNIPEYKLILELASKV
jgi:transcription initiation factor IIE alpha subunit